MSDEWWDEDSGHRVLVETEGGGTVELLAERGRVIVRLEFGERMSTFHLTPGAASNIGRRLQGVAKHAQEMPACHPSDVISTQS